MMSAIQSTGPGERGWGQLLNAAGEDQLEHREWIVCNSEGSFPAGSNSRSGKHARQLYPLFPNTFSVGGSN